MCYRRGARDIIEPIWLACRSHRRRGVIELRSPPLSASLIVHRYGRLEPGDRIVLVIAASAHREAAFEASHFLIDWLKTKAPFWKLEDTEKGAQWVAAEARDDAAARRWVKSS